METFKSKGISDLVAGRTLITFIVEDAITREHAISLAAHEAYDQGYGDAELHQSWFEMKNPDIWFVQYVL